MGKKPPKDSQSCFARRLANFECDHWMHFGALLLLCVLVRLPFYLPSVIDWDESTFIVVGQGILDGRLPYVELWDNKPPLAFAFFALVILLNKSIFAVRLAGTICVLTSAYLTYHIGRRIWGKGAGFLAGILSAVFISLTASGQATMTEVIALVPAVGALAVLVTRRWIPSTCFLAGSLVSSATLVRLNLSFLAVAIGIFIVYWSFAKSAGSVVRQTVAYIMGGLVPLLLVCLPYVIEGQFQTFVNSVFVAPLYYVASNHSPPRVLVLLVTRGFDFSNALLWMGFLGGCGFIVRNWWNYDKTQQYRILLIAVFFFSVTSSIVTSGHAHLHYLIQLIPFLSLIASSCFSVLLQYRYKIAIFCLLAVGLLKAGIPVFEEYLFIATRLATNKSLPVDAGYQIASYLKEANPSQKPFYMMTDHIVHWLTDTQPMSKSVTHPSNISKEYLLKSFLGPDASAEGEIFKLLERKPSFIVKMKKPWYLNKRLSHVLEEKIKIHYVLVKVIEGRYIYRRRQPEHATTSIQFTRLPSSEPT
jgi:hypothetical protein